MVRLKEHYRKAIVFLILVFALISVVMILTEARTELEKTNGLFFAIAAFFFIASILIWLFSWALLIKKNTNLSFSKILTVGFSSVYGALTPVQLGAEALRSIQLKYYFKVSYQESISASMVVKGLKFLVLLIVSLIVISLFFSNVKLEPAILLAFASGFAVVVLAVIVFLLPLKKSFGISIAAFFQSLSKFFRQFEGLSVFFKGYSEYLEKTTIAALFLTLVLASISFAFEFSALYFAFAAANIIASLKALLVLMILVSILERTPLLPRGIGIVELVAFSFMSLPAFSDSLLSTAQIGAAIITFDIVRLVIPTIASLAVLALSSKKLEEENLASTSRRKKAAA
ncbi:MAG: flippase-like domain-containing protein [Candidatus Diapherotrites archaeon]|uniref:Flippase-like domain-containing protein n=1 Tax=Candidatus Iainarchaeum sp. TaxID=3101447 RepID=A0A7J4KTR4_9ARCH|nr:flippase-like domain-containing protein [Candidatus Diapherotrites archaeon]HIH21069.1 hypothetical protein [Candidatus Diapherotrites archaeon]HIH33312.1 hypothetical protein [Candidatus Diapherotrites archaeon]